MPSRGGAFSSRAAGYGAYDGPEHTARSNSVDAVFIGPNDLAHAMGHENRWTDAPVQAAIERTLKAVAAAGKCPGILALTPADEEKYASWGARYFASVTTGIIMRAFKEAAQGGRAQLNY